MKMYENGVRKLSRYLLKLLTVRDQMEHCVEVSSEKKIWASNDPNIIKLIIIGDKS